MRCLCDKLRTKQYLTITRSEAELLKVTQTEAPHLFRLTPRPEPQLAQSPPPPPESSSAPITSRVQKRLRSRKRSTRSPTPRRPTRLPSTINSSQTADSQPASSPVVAELVGTYCPPSTTRLSGAGSLSVDQASVSGGVFVRIFLIIERSTRRLEAQQLFRRICCYAFAQLHSKGQSVDPVVRDIENALPRVKSARQKVYDILRVGSKWATVLHSYSSIERRPTSQLTGLLCLLGSSNVWERASARDQRAALSILAAETDLRDRVVQYYPLVRGILEQIQLVSSFIDETPALAFTRCTTPLGRGSDSLCANFAALPSTCASPAVPGDTSTGMSPSPWVPPGGGRGASSGNPSAVDSEDAMSLLTFASFLSPSDPIASTLLHRGTTPRKRWTKHGQVEEAGPLGVDIDPKLIEILSNSERLDRAWEVLQSQNAVTKTPDGAYVLDAAVTQDVREKMTPEQHIFWKRQVLAVVYRAVPWKYLEVFQGNDRVGCLSHLKHALQAFERHLGRLSGPMTDDLAMTLVEASRFPGLPWKRLAVAHAAQYARASRRLAIHSRIHQSQRVIDRITGSPSCNPCNSRDSDNGLARCDTALHADGASHATAGLEAIQQALDHVQADDVVAARKVLQDWTILGETPTLMEQVVLFRINMMLGRILRFGGDFSGSLAHLNKARQIQECSGDLVFDEDIGDFTCDIADTFRELDDPAAAERLTRQQIGRRNHGSTTSGSDTRLELALAEALFAQERFNEAEAVCLDVKSRTRLLKFERLRLNITLAKICHVNRQYQGALSYWSEAMAIMGKFPMGNGRATRVIVVSICDTLNRLGHSSLVQDSLRQVASLDELAKPGGVEHWISGLRHWLDFLRSQDVRSRI